jgi:UTP--glucose-1-phosphate uridylyltransferase
MAAQPIRSALPTHLKPPGANNGGDEGEFAKRHHGKTRSHMVSF